MQEVFACVWNQRTHIPESAALSAYIYKSVHNKIFDIFRHQQIVQKWIEKGRHYIDVADGATDYLIREKDIEAIIQKRSTGCRRSLKPLTDEMAIWGKHHRQKVSRGMQ